MYVFFLFIASADLQIRLNGSGNNISGRVEIFNPNFGWGTVCDNYWDITDSNVVCRQLGFTGANAVIKAAYYGKGRGPILLDDVGCNGKESYIWDCPHGGWNKHDCSHSSDAGVECLCKKGYTFDGARCVGMYPLMYYNFKNSSTSITAQMS
jgi:deleted-in-malignant-brain-tumors protein 1